MGPDSEGYYSQLFLLGLHCHADPGRYDVGEVGRQVAPGGLHGILWPLHAPYSVGGDSRRSCCYDYHSSGAGIGSGFHFPVNQRFHVKMGASTRESQVVFFRF
uniref:Uncharacterized protein n=1 Tax=Cacopsylla melanoneura TaxID=428564 RepID=A0A8D8MDB1_9HEMI